MRGAGAQALLQPATGRCGGVNVAGFACEWVFWAWGSALPWFATSKSGPSAFCSLQVSALNPGVSL